jgi:DNA repair exonuclease SbcCD ATPase subunit
MLDKHILKINHKSFSQIVVLGSASFVPFMQLSAAHRREVIEDLLDIQIFTTMNTLLKTKIATNRQAIQDNSYARDTVEGKIELENLHIKEIKANTEETIKQKEQQVKSLKEEMDEAQNEVDRLQAEVTNLLASISDQDKVRSRLEKVVAIGRQLDSKAIKIQNETRFFNDHSDCPTCRQGIADEHRTTIVEKANSQLAEVQQGREKIAEEVVRLNARQSVISDVLSEVSNKTASISERNVRIRTLTGFSASITNEIKQLKLHKQAETNVDRLQELKDQYATLVLECEQLLIDRNTLDVASVILKDTGIKTKIIRQYIPIINKLINKYLASMDFFVNFELNENFEETIKSRFRDEFSYASFSEGEKSRIDLALLFTWRAVAKLRNSASTNLLILDEVFDGSLDAQGNEELLKILQTITEGNNVFVISHKTDTYLDKFERVLKFQKQKNFSNMVEL